MSEEIIEEIETTDYVPGMHNPTALVNNPFCWKQEEEQKLAKTNVEASEE